MKPDFGKTASDYARYRVGFPAELFERLERLGIGRSGQRVLDLGTGAGSLGRAFATRGCRVTGLDKSAELIAEAKRLDREEGLDIDYVLASAEHTRLEGDQFDLVSAGQCWHWFERDRAAREAMRLLRSGGHLLITHFDWIPTPGNVVEATERLVAQHNPEWKLGGGRGIYPRWLSDAQNAGFARIETFSFDVEVPFTHEAWRGRMRSCAGVGATLDPDAVQAFDAELKKMLEKDFPEQPLVALHHAFALIGVAL